MTWEFVFKQNVIKLLTLMRFRCDMEENKDEDNTFNEGETDVCVSILFLFWFSILKIGERI